MSDPYEVAGRFFSSPPTNLQWLAQNQLSALVSAFGRQSQWFGRRPGAGPSPAVSGIHPPDSVAAGSVGLSGAIRRVQNWHVVSVLPPACYRRTVPGVPGRRGPLGTLDSHPVTILRCRDAVTSAASLVSRLAAFLTMPNAHVRFRRLSCLPSRRRLVSCLLSAASRCRRCLL